MDATQSNDSRPEAAVDALGSMPGVCAVRMRWTHHWRRGPFWLGVLTTFLGVVAMGFAIAGLHTAIRAMGGGRSETLLAVVGALLIFMAGFAWLWTCYDMHFLREIIRGLPPDSKPAAYYRAQLSHRRVGGLFSRRTRAKWVEDARSTDQWTWVDERLVPWLGGVQRTPSALEPERVGSFFAQFEVSFGMVACIMGTVQLVGRNWVPGIVWGCVGLVMVARLIHRRALFEPVVAGQGWVQHGRARWTVADSAMVIKRGRHRKSVTVTVIGPAGALRLNLSLKPGADAPLRDLWARWCHPEPNLKQAAFDA